MRTAPDTLSGHQAPRAWLRLGTPLSGLPPPQKKQAPAARCRTMMMGRRLEGHTPLMRRATS
jgi:hypothetical protein